MSAPDLKIVAHKGSDGTGIFGVIPGRYWFEVVGPLDSCGHRHETRIEAGACKRQMGVSR